MPDHNEPADVVADWRPAGRLPDPAVRVLDPRFRRYVVPLARVERLATGCRWAEGPVWFGDARCLIWSDIPNDRMLRWDEPTGVTSVWRRPSNFANGNTRDRAGRLVTCEHGGRRVTRTEYDGTVTVLAEGHAGKRLNSPNDVVVTRDGSVWFTDPAYGIAGDYEGHRATAELPTDLYRLDGVTGELSVAASGLRSPNGLAFSPDEALLYVADTGWVVDRSAPRHIRAYDVVDGRCENPRVFAEVRPGVPDGFRVDEQGRVWTSSEDSVQVFDPDGRLIERVPVPERVGNLCFGGVDGTDLYIVASTSLYRIRTTTRQAGRPPR